MSFYSTVNSDVREDIRERKQTKRYLLKIYDQWRESIKSNNVLLNIDENEAFDFLIDWGLRKRYMNNLRFCNELLSEMDSRDSKRLDRSTKDWYFRLGIELIEFQVKNGTFE